MGVRFAIRRLTVRTATDEAVYEFADGINAITGPIGTGKSSMLELIKYALGGRAQIMPAVRENVTTVSARVIIGDRTLDMARGMNARLVDVSNPVTGERVGTWATTHRKHIPRAAQELLSFLGLPADMRVPRRPSRPTGETVPITFFDVYRYIYLSQNSIDTSVVGHSDSNLNIKRRAVFELLYELTNPRLLEVVAHRGRLAQEIERARVDARAIGSFLRQVDGQDAPSLRERYRQATARLEEAERRLTVVREQGRAEGVSGELASEIQAMRSRLMESEERVRVLTLEIDKERAMLAQLALDEEASRRTDVATQSLSGLEFSICPRCLQSVESREVLGGRCLLCTQPHPRVEARRSVAFRLHEQRIEVEALLEQDAGALVEAERLAAALREQLGELLDRAQAQTGTTLPGLQDVEDAARAATNAKAEVETTVAALARWANYEDRVAEADQLERRIRELVQEENELRMALQSNNDRLARLSERYDAIVRGFNVPWYSKGEIDPKTYLPMLGGQPFDLLSVGGARKTLVNLAYHLANLVLTIEEYDVALPTLLIVDSPRKNVGENENDRAVADAIYGRLRTIQDASSRPFQVIVADNDLPASTRGWLTRRIELSYDSPLVPGVEHPGEGVPTLASEGVAAE